MTRAERELLDRKQRLIDTFLTNSTIQPVNAGLSLVTIITFC